MITLNFESKIMARMKQMLNWINKTTPKTHKITLEKEPMIEHQNKNAKAKPTPSLVTRDS